MKKLFSIVFFIFVANFATAQKSLDKLLKTYNSQSIPYISVEELRMLQLKNTPIILDARERNEFQVSHIASSKNIGFNEFNSKEKQLQQLDKSAPIIVYCSVGIRSEQIGEKLKKAGFTDVRNLYGGIFEWKNKKYPIIDSTDAETEDVHTFSKMWSNYLHAGNPIY